MNLAEKIVNELNSLGETPDDIAANLRRRKIKGTKAVSSSCPLANYLEKKTGQKAEVGSTSVKVFEATKAYSASWSIQVTPTIAEFIKKFDSGHYPFLEKS